jgi:hypothetical protein
MGILYDLLGEADLGNACLEEAYRYRQPLLQLANAQLPNGLRSGPLLREMLAKSNSPLKDA